ncbi:vitamin B12 transporter [Stella humosa]|uniref:Vitamin B12 transporter n=1 Tax=Stella humosa TaxID=94 RepID=A0A3N1MFN6_9PROT|nr:TonB-dependent receptor [Stella humosa]ROQ01480.1 vitamin B12 transporter [Stella humosa]BBK31858.1 TonB-dependent receptor [Stella humosa]
MDRATGSYFYTSVVTNSVRVGAGALAGAVLAATPATAQQLVQGGAAVTLPPVVVSANLVPTPVDQVGSSVTVLTREDIERTGDAHVIDLLKRVPGVTINHNGGPGATAQLRIRGSDTGQVKVLIDGVEVNDTTGTSNDFDFNAFLVTEIEQIEVLRGPQSALYGNDAMGGVINIITRKGQGPMRVTGLVEGGSYQTFRQAVGVSGSLDRFSYALSGANFQTKGFSRVTAGDEKDGTKTQALNGRFSYDFNAIFSLEAAGGFTHMVSEYDPSSTRDGPNEIEKHMAHGRLAAKVKLLEGRWDNTLAVTGSRTERDYDQPGSSTRFSTYDGDRYGVEYRGAIKIDRDDVLTFGVARETETARATNTRGTVKTTDLDRELRTDSIYAQYLLGLWDDLHLTAGVRHDDNEGFGGSTTYRVTGAYTVPVWRTILRASYGTAVKAPTLFQLYAPIYGNDSLRAEKSKGFDFGFEQPLLNGRVTIGATAFHNDYRNLIAFQDYYVNIARARTQGIEATVKADVTSDLSLGAAYTLLDTEDRDTGRDLPRRPRHSVNLSADYLGLKGFRIGGAVRYVASQANSASSTVRLKPFYVVDALVSYDVTERVAVYVRAENLFDEKYQEALGYRTPGRSAYVGVKANF